MEEYDLEEDLRGYCERRNCLYNEEGALCYVGWHFNA